MDKLSNGKVDLTFGSYVSLVPLLYVFYYEVDVILIRGSALDIFGGTGVRFDELVALDKKHRQA